MLGAAQGAHDSQNQANMSEGHGLTCAAGVYATGLNNGCNRVVPGAFGRTVDRQSIVLLNASARRLLAGTGWPIVVILGGQVLVA